MADFVKLANTAQRLVAKNGRPVTIRRLSQAPADVNKPWKGPTNPQNNYDAQVTTPAVFVPPASLVQLGKSTIDEDMLKRVDQVAIVAPGPTETADLSTFNEILDENNTVYKVEFTETLRPASTTLVYFMGVSR